MRDENWELATGMVAFSLMGLMYIIGGAVQGNGWMVACGISGLLVVLQKGLVLKHRKDIGDNGEGYYFDSK